MALLPVDEARGLILGRVNPLPEEEVQISDAMGRGLARSIAAVRTLPPWDNSAMDGYAVSASEVARTPIHLPVSQTIFAGDRPRGPLQEGTVARIMTGAPLPLGADAVVMQEQTQRVSDGPVEILQSVASGTNVRRRGEDVAVGAKLFESGHSLSVSDAGLLWAQGLTQVSVHRRPRVSIVSSGDELRDLGDGDQSSIIDTNTPVIAEVARRAGAVVRCDGRARDTLESARAHFEKGLDSDVLITLAGASVGERDFTRDALVELGATLDFWKVAMKPGKPLLFGRRGSTLIFGLPGNPVSALVTFELFVRPALRALQGLSSQLEVLPARMGARVSKPAGLRHFLRGTTVIREGRLWATPRGSQSSGALTSVSGATCLIDVPAEVTTVEEGQEINVLPASWA